jgi:hypothetical protein
MTGSAGETVIAPRKSKAETLPGPERRSKRTAAYSPSSSPYSKPKPKRRARGKNNNKAAAREVVTEQDDDQSGT